MKVLNFSQALTFLHRRISKRTSNKFPGNLGIQRTKYLLKLLRNPQNKIKIIHIAGTSGKGSTAYFTSTILKSLGFKVGLHLSPHIIDLRERFQIDNQLITKKQFCHYLGEVIPIIKKVDKTKFGKPTYFEILVVLAFHIFHKEQVNYAVIETGLGGLYDATNTVKREDKLVILTKIGLDHTKILGKTLDKIAFQKAKIIKSKNRVISVWQGRSVRVVIENIVRGQKAKLSYIKKNANSKKIKISHTGITFNFYFKKLNLPKIKINLLAEYQVENLGSALAATYILSQKDDFNFKQEPIREGLLKMAAFPARMEIFKSPGKIIIIDGAHNPQKMATFTKSLQKIYPHQKYTFLIAVKKEKNSFHMLKYIIPLAEKIFVTKFSVGQQDLLPLSENPNSLIKKANQLGFRNITAISNPYKALSVANTKSGKFLVITGSLYLIGKIYQDLKSLQKSKPI